MFTQGRKEHQIWSTFWNPSSYIFHGRYCTNLYNSSLKFLPCPFPLGKDVVNMMCGKHTTMNQKITLMNYNTTLMDPWHLKVGTVIGWQGSWGLYCWGSCWSEQAPGSGVYSCSRHMPYSTIVLFNVQWIQTKNAFHKFHV